MFVFRFLFPVSLFLGAFLLFSIQPMAAKVLLPIYGGTPAIWTVCMLFFQCILLLAYAYVTLFPLINRARWWLVLHTGLIVLSLLVMPILFQPQLWFNQPEQNILYNLLTQLGLPLLVVGSSAPLLQFLYSQTTNKKASDPYFLYSASNVGSLIALLAYPWLIEQYIGLATQFRLWNILYLVYSAILLSLMLLFKYKPLNKSINHSKTWSRTSIATWLFLSFVPCSLMLGVTLFITTDIAATPLFWVIPLILYLLTFILAFRTKPLITSFWINNNALIFLIFIFLGFIIGPNQIKAWELTLIHLAGFFVIALMCHTKLYESRPPTQHLTLFYFCLALGGVLAGIFNGIIAPNVLNQVYEYPIAIALSLFAFSNIKSKKGWWMFPLILVLFIAAYYTPRFSWYTLSSLQITALIGTAFTFIGHKNKADLIISLSLLLLFIFLFPPGEGETLLQKRNFYGVKRVANKDELHLLIHQTTAHGFQYMKDKKPFSGDSSYYGAVKKISSLMQQTEDKLTVTVVGLGAGTLLCQFRSDDTLNVVEIDPQVIDLAKDNSLFTYLRDCLPQQTLLNKDGRMAIAELPDASQDIIILDAFTSDAIPVHLMTLEAFRLYQQKLTPNGIILVNLSNRHLNVLPVMNAIGRSLDLMVFYINHQGEASKGQFDSKWAILTSNESLARPVQKLGWHFVSDDTQFLWTDDYSNIIPLLR